MLTYFFLLLVPLLMLALLAQLVPSGAMAQQFDIALWLLTPVIAPSIYTAYRDIFTRI